MEWFEALGTFEQILYVMAGVSTFAFIIKGVLLVIGADTDMLDAPDDALATADAFEVQYISVVGVLSFFAIGSWSAIAIFAASTSIAFAIIGGIVDGLIMMYIIARLIHALKKLQESGNMQIPKAIERSERFICPSLLATRVAEKLRSASAVRCAKWTPSPWIMSPLKPAKPFASSIFRENQRSSFKKHRRK